jgi:hypothetical protein
MTLAEFQIDLKETNSLLGRIAYALERIAGPDLSLQEPRRRGSDALVTYGDAKKEWLQQQAANLIHPQGLAPAEEAELIQQTLDNYQKLGGGAEDEE